MFKKLIQMLHAIPYLFEVASYRKDRITQSTSNHSAAFLGGDCDISSVRPAIRIPARTEENHF